MAGIAEISMMLMQKYKLNNGKVGVEKVEAWQNSDIIDFLSCATSSTAAVELRRVSLRTIQSQDSEKA